MAGPVVLSPASPYELLEYIIAYQTYPTTLLICSTRESFFSSLVQDVQSHLQRDPDSGEYLVPADEQLSLLAAPLYQRAIARHIRLLFVPTVTHLRSYLAIFTPDDAKMPPPPGVSFPSSSTRQHPPLLLVYGFLELHRGSSEWSAQGISNTAAALVESAGRTHFKASIVEPRGSGGHVTFEALLADSVPVLSGGGGGRREGGWTGRTIDIRRILGRWFRFQTGQWDTE